MSLRPIMPESLRAKLREATHHQHTQLNNHPLLSGLMQADYPIENYYKLLLAYDRLYQVLEEQIIHFIAQYDANFDYHSRLKWPLIKQDLGYLNIAPLQVAPSLKNPVINSIGQLIGVLYVVEGSTLGAQFIARSLEKHHGLSQTKGGRFFYGYGEETQKNWQDFIGFIETIANQPEQCPQALDSANQTFDYFNLMLKEYLTISL